MTSHLIEAIAKEDIGFNKPASQNELLASNVVLKSIGLPAMPTDLIKILLHYNGLSNEGALLLGVEQDNFVFPNLVVFNKKFFNNQASNTLIIGYDEFSFLIFDKINNDYKLIEKDTFEVVSSSKELLSPLGSLMCFVDIKI